MQARPHRHRAIGLRMRTDNDECGHCDKDDELPGKQILVKHRMSGASQIQCKERQEADGKQPEIAPTRLDRRTKRHREHKNAGKYGNEPGIAVRRQPSPGEAAPRWQRLIEPGIEPSPQANESPYSFAQPVVCTGFRLSLLFIHRRGSSHEYRSERMTSAAFSAIM